MKKIDFIKKMCWYVIQLYSHKIVQISVCILWITNLPRIGKVK